MEGLKASLFVFLCAISVAIVGVSLFQFPLHIAMIVMGAKYKDDCPVESMIPIYLIVAGAVSIFANFCICCLNCCNIKHEERLQQSIGNTFKISETEANLNPLLAVAQLFLFAWFICGNVWIYKNYEPNYSEPGSSDFCDKTLYLFAFWVTTSNYIIYGVVFLIMCFVSLC